MTEGQRRVLGWVFFGVGVGCVVLQLPGLFEDLSAGGTFPDLWANVLGVSSSAMLMAVGLIVALRPKQGT